MQHPTTYSFSDKFSTKEEEDGDDNNNNNKVLVM